MLELGRDSEQEHQKILDYCRDNKIKLITVGPIFKKLNINEAYESVEQVSSELISMHAAVILLKGSRGIELEKLITFL